MFKADSTGGKNVKRSLAILLVLVITATAFFVPLQINSISTKNSGKTGDGKAGVVTGTSFDPLSDEYIIDEQSSQFDFFENYDTVAEMKEWAENCNKWNYTTFGGKGIFDTYAQKLGITNKSLTEYQRIAKIYYYLEKTWRGTGEAHTAAASAFIFRKAHCETYANAFMELCKRANIECWTISSSRHEWNIVKLDNKYYQCDPMGLIFLASVQDAVNGYAGQWMEIMNYDASEHYSGNDALKKWSAKYKSSISTSDYALPKETTGLDTPKTTVTATNEGVVVKWDAVSNADWYEVYYANIDGITNNASKLSKGQSMWDTVTIKYNDGDYAYFKYGTSSCDSQGNIYFKNAGKTIHSIDKNEKGQYQFFINNDKLSGYGTAIVVVAKNVDHKTSVSTRDAKAMAEIIGTNLVTQTVTSIDKNTNETIKGTTILKINENNYVINKDCNSKSHNFSVKVATLIQATKNAQGAEVYECPECLQRKMVYTKAGSSTTPTEPTEPSKPVSHTHSWDNGQITKAATCTATGVKTFTCTTCKETKTETIEKTAHKPVTVTTGVSANKEGSVVSKCSVCGTVLSTTSIAYPKTVTLSNSTYVYNGSARKPIVTVKDSVNKVIDAKNYTVSYENNTNVGTATVKVVFKGNYSGSLSKTFTIIPAATTVTNLAPIYKGFTVTWNKQTTQTTGYQIQYATKSDFSNAATITMDKPSYYAKKVTDRAANTKYYVRVRTYKVIKGKNYYSAWSATKNITTTNYPTNITLSSNQFGYNGKAKSPAVTVKDNNGKKVAAKYYTVSYPVNRTNVGTYKVTVKFRNGYSGCTTKTFQVNPTTPSLVRLTPSSKALKVNWKGNAIQTSGYQIQYSTNSKFGSSIIVNSPNGSDHTKKLSNLTGGKKYFVRVRSYKKVNNKTYYSAWSNTKSIVTKK